MTTFFLDRFKSVLGYYPQSHAGTTAVTSAAIDRLGFRSAIVIVNYAATTSDPSAATLTFSAVDGADTSPATAVTFNATPAVINAKTTAGVYAYQIDLSGFNRYFKISMTPAFTGGTDPSIVAGMTVILCDAAVDPASGTAVTPLRKA